MSKKMNQYQLKIWNELSNLVDHNEAFYYVDQERDGFWCRIFLYRLASYTDFLAPCALEARGTTFYITEEGPNAEPIALICLPFSKFFNLNENPITTDLDLSEVQEVTLKMDGSLISTYSSPDGKLYCKSKGSLHSDHAKAAESFLNNRNNTELQYELWNLDMKGYTVNMEWCAPGDFRIVIGYNKPQLTILSVRRRDDGQYMSPDNELIRDLHPQVYALWTPRYDPLPEYGSYEAFINAIPEMQGIEGYVIQLKSGQRVKLKTNWYLTQHRAKDSINSDRRLFEAVLAESTDDLRTLFHDNSTVIQRIESMEKRAGGIYNHVVDLVERFYERNKHLERKDYAILGQQELQRREFSLAMQKYLGKPIDYKQWMVKHYKDFGISDIEVSED